MSFSRDPLDPALLFVAALAFFTALLTAWVVPQPRRLRSTPLGEPGQLIAVIAAAAALSIGIADGADVALATAVVAATLAAAIRLLLPRFSMAGALRLSLLPLGMVVGVPWLYLLLAEHGYPAPVLAFVAIGALLSLPRVLIDLLASIPRTSLLTHARFERPTEAPAPLRRHGLPMVSVHVACHAEPPEVVIETLEAIARIDYPNFEVLVCDNNTPDEALWRPLEAACARLNAWTGRDRFRFFHVAPLSGAKAGALNWLLQRTDPTATLVAVLDADYVTRPDFLSRLVGFFEDASVGFVQTPHDYRDWEANPYLRACYWEYRTPGRLIFPSYSEYDAAFTIGTMCVVRSEALRAAGGWAEWCLTEDSEVAVRIRDAGYSGIFLDESFGRGLIPETFEAYRTQRFRWTAGPSQQLRRHWRSYLPMALGGSSRINGWSKLVEATRSLDDILPLALTLAGSAGVSIGLVSMAVGNLPKLALPDVVWVTIALGTATGLVELWHRYRLIGTDRLGDILLGELARRSLTSIRLLAGPVGLASRPFTWKRTPKFKAHASWLRAISSTLPELTIGLALLLSPLGLFVLGFTLEDDVARLAILGSVASSIDFFAAPLMALLAEHSLAREEGSRHGELDPGLSVHSVPERRLAA